MPFWNDIERALGGEDANLEGDLCDRIVEDRLGEAAALRTVLLCESPHHAEISHGHPLAGNSGKTVTKAFARNLPDFNGRKEPIGCLLHCYPQCVNADGQPPPPVNGPVLNSLGLMNVSRLPLNSEAYCFDARRQYSELLCYFKTIKSRLERENPDQGIQYLERLDASLPPSRVYTALRDDLIRRLNCIPQGVIVVPCGKVANAFFHWATRDCGYQGCVTPYNCFVPHPSLNSWQPRREGPRVRNYGPTINRLVETIAERAAIVS